MEQNFFEKPFVFMNKEYKDGPQLVKALIENWDIAVSVLRRGDLKGFEAQADKIWEGKEEESCAFQKALHQLDPSLSGIPFMDKEKKKAEIISFEQVGKILSSTQKGDPYYDTFKGAAKSGVFSAYMPQLRELENILAQGGDKKKREEAGKKFDLKLHGKKYLRYQGVTYTSDQEFASKAEEVLEDGYEETFQFLEDLYESDECRRDFQIWGQETDADRKNHDFALLHQKWTELRKYMEDDKGKEWKNCIQMRNIMKDTPDLKSIWENVDCFRNRNRVEEFLLSVKKDYEHTIKKFESHIEEYRLIHVMLNEMGRVLLDEGKKKTESIESYDIWIDTSEVIRLGNESMALFKDAAEQVEKVLECYRHKRLMEGLKTANNVGKKYLMDVMMFPATKASSDSIDNLLNEVKKNEEDAGMAFLCLSEAARFFLSNKELVHQKNFRIEGELADEYYLEKIDLFSGEIAEILKHLGKQKLVDGYRREWRGLAELLGKPNAPSCRSKLDALIDDWEKLYQQMKGEGKKLVDYMPPERLQLKSSYRNKLKEYRLCKTEYRKLENTFGEVIQNYKDKLEKKYQAVKCCGDAEYGQLLEGSRKACEEFFLEVNEAESATSLAAQKRNAAFDKAKNLLEELEKREAAAEEKKKKASARKRFIKKHRAKVLVALALIGFGIFFYSRYMTSTYYGTAFYLGKMFDYEEYTIAEGATKIASNVFQGMENLKTIEIPDTVEQIEEGAFADCTKLETIVIPQSVTQIGERAFGNCTSLKKLEFAGADVTLSNYVFENCVSLEKITAPKQLHFDNASVFKNCHSLDVDHSFSNGNGSDNLRYNLYTDTVSGTALLNNEVQLMNFLYGKKIYSEEMDIYETLSNIEGVFSNIKITKPGEAGISDARFSFDYEEGIKSFGVEGILSGSSDEELTWEFDCIRAELLLDELLLQDEEGYYVKLPALMADETITESNYGWEIGMNEEEITVNELMPLERTEDAEWTNGFSVQARLHKDFGDFGFSGTLMIYSDGSTEFKSESGELLNRDILGTYRRADGEEKVFSIDAQYGNYYSVSGMASEDNPGRSVFFLNPNPTKGETLITTEDGGFATYFSYLEWNDEYLVIDDIPYQKMSEETGTLPEDKTGLVGVWEGTYMNRDRTRTAFCRKTILPMGPENELRAIYDFGPLKGRDDYESGTILESVIFDAETQDISFVGQKWFDRPGSYSFADFVGKVNSSFTNMSGDGKYAFQMKKVE
ncbi:MAG: leucine-rich repeat domain-containing protein [Suilimivivens sp.]